MNYLKAGWPYLACLILGLLWAQSCASARTNEERSKALIAAAHDSIKVAEGLAIHDTLILTHEIRRLDTIIRIRTVVLTKVDSSWMRSDSLIQLVPASDSACHLAYTGLKSGCELLREQVVADTGIFRSLQDSAKVMKGDNVRLVNSLVSAQARIDTLAKVKVCHVGFVKWCPSRTLSFILGDAAGIAAVLFLHH